MSIILIIAIEVVLALGSLVLEHRRSFLVVIQVSCWRVELVVKVRDIISAILVKSRPLWLRRDLMVLMIVHEMRTTIVGDLLCLVVSGTSTAVLPWATLILIILLSLAIVFLVVSIPPLFLIKWNALARPADACCSAFLFILILITSWGIGTWPADLIVHFLPIIVIVRYFLLLLLGLIIFIFIHIVFCRSLPLCTTVGRTR